MKEEETLDALLPFMMVESENMYSFILEEVGEYKDDLFQTRADEGFLGNGYDWESLACVFLEERMPDLADSVEFDSEADMFCAYSSDKDDLYRFATGFKKACEDDELIGDLFSRAELS